MRFVAIALIACCLSSCGYWRDRWADAKDIVTVGAGIGVGGVARVGPLQAGLGIHCDEVGLLNGEWVDDASSTPFSHDEGDKTSTLACTLVLGAWEDDFGERRGKDGGAVHALVPIQGEPHWPSAAAYTQIEVSADALVGVHVGFNPGELLDFILGFVGIDIYGDDERHRPKPRGEGDD